MYTDEINVGTPPEERKPLKNKVTVAVEEQHAKERTAGSKAKQQNNNSQQGNKSCIHDAIIEYQKGRNIKNID